MAKVQGNPFFIESLVEGLVEEGLLEEDDGRQSGCCARSLQSLQAFRTPFRTWCSTASICCRSWRSSSSRWPPSSAASSRWTRCTRCCRRASSWRTPSEAMATLTSLGMVLLEMEEPYTCLFKHIVIRDVAYNTLLVSAREDLHRRLARFMERTRRGQPGEARGHPRLPLPGGERRAEGAGVHAHGRARRQARSTPTTKPSTTTTARWRCSPSPMRWTGTRSSMKRARSCRSWRETLLQAGNYAAAIHMFEQLPGRTRSVDGRRAEIHVGLGRAFQEKGESGKAIQELELALKLLGRTTPRSHGGAGAAHGGAASAFTCWASSSRGCCGRASRAAAALHQAAQHAHLAHPHLLLRGHRQAHLGDAGGLQHGASARARTTA